MALKVLLLNDTSQEPHLGCMAAGGAVRSWISTHPMVGNLTVRSVQHSWKSLPQPSTLSELERLSASGSPDTASLATLIQSADCVIVNGEGTILRNRPAVRYLLGALRIAEAVSVPTAVVNATIVPGDDRSLYEMMSSVFPGVGLFCLREIESSAVLRQWGVKAVCSTDASFAVLDTLTRRVLPPGPTSGKPVIVLGSVRLTASSRRGLSAFLTRFAAAADVTYTFLSITRNDEQHLEYARSLVGGKHYRFRHLDERSAMALMGEAALIITGRYHGAVLATMAQRPFLFYETHSNRIKWLCKQMGISGNAIRLLKEPDMRGALEIGLDHLGWKGEALQEILREEVGFQVRLAERQKGALDEFLRDPRLGDRAAATSQTVSDANQRSFRRRAEAAAKILPRGLRVADFGGYAQSLAKVYDFGSYVSYDQLGTEENVAGRPKRALCVDQLPYPDAHREVDLEKQESFPEVRGYDVAVCLGLLMWLENWREFLLKLRTEGFSWILLSWDDVGLDRAARFLADIGYRCAKVASAERNSKVGLFERAT